MKILLMEVPWYAFFSKANQPDAPLGVSYLGAVLEKASHDVRIYNPDLKTDDELGVNDFKNEMDDYRVYLASAKGDGHPIWQRIKAVIDDFRPEVVGLTVRTPAVELAAKTARLVKSIDPSILVVAGGPHATCKPGEMASLEDVDVVVFGEGEDTAVDLVARHSRGEGFNGCRGTVYTDGGKVVTNPPRPLIEDLDSIPFPAKYLVMGSENMHSDNFANIFATRGCPFSCTFCSSFNVWSKRVRYRSPENVVAEMKFMEKKYSSEFFSFADDSFTVNKQWVLRLCELIRNENFSGHFRWVCNTKPNLLDEEMVKALKSSGCVAVALGVESGNDRVLEKMKKGATCEDARRAVALLKKHDLRFSGQFVVGFPWETEREVLDTVEFMKELDPISVMLSVATPLPGTELFDEAVKMGLIDEENVDWSRVTTKNDGMLFNPEIPKDRVSELVAYAREEAEKQERKWAEVRYDYKKLRQKKGDDARVA